MTAKYTVQHLGFPVTRRIEPDEWKVYSTHDTESAAWKAITRATEHLDYGSWDDHYRVIASDGSVCDRDLYYARAEAARVLGAYRSEKKAASSRINGTKGGRPRIKP